MRGNPRDLEEPQDEPDICPCCELYPCECCDDPEPDDFDDSAYDDEVGAAEDRYLSQFE